MTRRDTSLVVFADMASTAPILRAKALGIVRASAGMTADEVAAALGVSILSIRPRMTELAQQKLVADCGIRRANASGRKAIVWVAVALSGEDA